MQIAFGRVRRKTSPARRYVRDCYSLKCPRIFGLYYKSVRLIHHEKTLCIATDRLACWLWC